MRLMDEVMVEHWHHLSLGPWDIHSTLSQQDIVCCCSGPSIHEAVSHARIVEEVPPSLWTRLGADGASPTHFRSLAASHTSGH